MRQRLTYFLLFCIVIWNFESSAADKLKIPQLKGEIAFDGKPNETAWALIDTLPVTLNVPVFMGKPSERTLIRIAYDMDFLWISAAMLVHNPSNIRAFSKKRDELSPNNDWFGIVIDNYNDNENALGFFTTPEGLRLDAAVSQDASSRDPLNINWNTFWDVKTTRDEKGWYCEMRIPFSSLRFQSTDGVTEMGIITWRFSAHNTEVSTFPPIDPKYGMMATWKPSLAQKVIFEGINPAKPVYLSPYVLGGFTKSNNLNSEETAYVHEEKFSREIGGDLKYAITSNLTMDLTVNTDFAQVEADDQQINLTRFSLFFPEKRMFFQERASVFYFGLGGPSNLFYSRRIGIDEDGNPVPILGGARVYGRMGKWDLGFLNMQTAKTNHVVSENFGALRIKRQVVNSNSFVGGMITNRIGTDGVYNSTYGLDATIRVFGDDYLETTWAQSFETGLENEAASWHPSRVRLGIERRSNKGFLYDVSLSHSGRDFNPGMGFEFRDNYRSIRTQIGWGWIPGEKSKILNHIIQGELMNFYDAVTGEVQSSYIGPNWEFQNKNFLMGGVELRRIVENVTEEFSFSDDVVVPVGKYEFYSVEGKLTTPGNYKVYAEMELNAGQFYDGARFSFTTSPYLNLSSSVQITGTYQFDAIGFSKRGQSLENHITRLKFQYMHSTKLSASSFVQYNTLNAAFIANFRIRYNPREGNDFYLVFNEIRNLKPEISTPRLPSLANRTLLLKYTHTFIL